MKFKNFKQYPDNYVRASKADTLDKYIGKDVWIRVKVSEKAYFKRGYTNDEYWIRILDKDGSSYIVNKVSSYKEYKGNDTQKNASLSRTYTLDKNSITIFDPIQTATTDAIFKDVKACGRITASDGYSYDEDYSHHVVEDIKHALFDENDMPQPAVDGTDHRLSFVTWVGDGHSFIVNYGDDEYRVQVTRELQ